VGRDFGVTTDGQAQQLPRLGLFSWENSLVGLNKGDVTYVQGQEDSAAGQLHVYAGHKQDHGNAFDRAGLTNGDQFVVDLHNEQVSTDAQFRATFGKNHPAPFDLGSDEQVDWDQTGAAQNADAAAKGLSLNRIEDGAFDPGHPEDFYFVTTEGGKDATSARDGGGLWRLSYHNAGRPWKGGTLTLLLDGSEAPFLSKPDNLGFDRDEHLLIQEDPGNNPHVARIVAYDVNSGQRAVLARFDPNLFQPGAAGFITQDEESSGIIDASRFLGARTFLFDAQVHATHPEADKVERGQLMTLQVPDWEEVFSE
jgi:secreted PhoX family phosphatase